ncbi:MAG: hypothetical protein R3F36_08140 [Candidatus Competibacteraceae bacterium]
MRDDILDVVGDTATLGKTQGSPGHGRSTSPLTHTAGLDGAREHARRAEALASLEPLGSEADPLRWLATYIVERVCH